MPGLYTGLRDRAMTAPAPTLRALERCVAVLERVAESLPRSLYPHSRAEIDAAVRDARAVLED